jgi:hypothetical protein
MKRYRVALTGAERDELAALLARGKADVRKLKHAQVPLKADAAEGGPGGPDARIAEAVGVGMATVERLRQRFVEEGLAAALSSCRGGRRVYGKKLDGEQEAHLIALACSTPPEGRARWTLRLLADRPQAAPLRRTAGAARAVPPRDRCAMVELRYVDSVSHETVRRALKKARAQAAPAQDVVHPAQAPGGVRLPHGRRSGGLPSPI